MPNSNPDLNVALGSLCFGGDDWPCHEERQDATERLKLAPGSADAFYMVAGMCFDLYRKFFYLFEALEPFAREADKTLVKKMADHGQALWLSRLREEKGKINWEAFAYRAAQIAGELHDEIIPRYEQLLRDVIPDHPWSNDYRKPPGAGV